MSLNLGLESLNNVNTSSVGAFTPASAVEMQNASEAITNLMASLENYYNAARNAMLVRRTIKQYGKTQSIVALVGQEGLATAMSFSMEGFWESTKNFLWKIWSKIKEWWGRFWGMFFSVEDKLRSYKSSLENKTLVQDCEFDAEGTNAAAILNSSAGVKSAVKALEAASKATGARMQIELQNLDALMGDTDGGVVKVAHDDIVHHVIKTVPDLKKQAADLIKVFEMHRDSKKNIDRYTDQFLRNVKNLKITAGRQEADALRPSKDVDARTNGAATAKENDTAIKLFKNAAKVNNQWVSRLLKVATTYAVKMMANTRTKNQD